MYMYTYGLYISVCIHTSLDCTTVVLVYKASRKPIGKHIVPMYTIHLQWF